MSKHTPAPWLIHGGYIFRADENGKRTHSQIGNVLGGSWMAPGEYEANRRLIASAPELLDALRRLLDEHAGQHSPGCVDLPPGYDATRCCPVAQARAAIAKATGEQPC